jgi:hypothetical protein
MPHAVVAKVAPQARNTAAAAANLANVLITYYLRNFGKAEGLAPSAKRVCKAIFN